MDGFLDHQDSLLEMHSRQVLYRGKRHIAAYLAQCVLHPNLTHELWIGAQELLTPTPFDDRPERLDQVEHRRCWWGEE